MSESVLSEIIALHGMSIDELKMKWLEVFNDAPQSNHRAFLFQRLAWRIQEIAHGGLRGDDAVQCEDFLGNANSNRPKRGRDLCKKRMPKTQRSSRGPIRDPRVPVAGTVLTKTYKGHEITVQVLNRGFEYQGREYRSLSAVARAITGTSWNGFAFFELAAGKSGHK